MDPTDRRIVQCLLHDPRAPFRRIAEVVGVSEQTAARRYRALVADGVVRVRALPGPGGAAEQTWFVRVQCRPDVTEALADALAAREDTSYVSVTSGGSEIVCRTRTDPARPQGSVLQRLPRTAKVLGFHAHAVLHMHLGPEAKWQAFDEPLTPGELAVLDGAVLRDGRRPAARPAGRRGADALRDADAPLLAELARDGRAGPVELARRTGWSTARVSTRLDEMLHDGALHVAVDLAYARFGFLASAYLWLTVAPGGLNATGEALSRHPGTSFAAAVTGAANLLVTVTCPTMDDLYGYVTGTVGALPAVTRVDVVPVLRRLKQAGTRIHDDRLSPA
ncbi:DNA-binding transcriptional regulator, Lrp family [Actinacidiphila yanglinensis]|uniref:DNA-binding transcriptional regulator, Lrp family n=1 Tax=Actinacidiphila yanglinensis TaxID=310779 RepID=A0A1H6EDL4_9ACTN|nr:Lrp/AsnC family transcriptional regulator [Actinacidiphila yanglinensis]SEG95351.1 DNA-binding transcriptional regulator, Lrp family [Actinacidiphila yanglinensis]